MKSTVYIETSSSSVHLEHGADSESAMLGLIADVVGSEFSGLVVSAEGDWLVAVELLAR